MMNEAERKRPAGEVEMLEMDQMPRSLALTMIVGVIAGSSFWAGVAYAFVR